MNTNYEYLGRFWETAKILVLYDVMAKFMAAMGRLCESRLMLIFINNLSNEKVRL